MATIVLSAAGAVLGAAFGPLGAVAGRALGATVGAIVDRELMGATGQAGEGPRLSDLGVQTSTEGRAVPRVYGRVRISGEMIWATRYEEETVRSGGGGGKGGPSVTNYRYHANFALGLCEGPIHRIGRVWADGVEIDRNSIALRIYDGTETQNPDPLIEAIQGAAPAYRGLAYVVFERLPLADFGNRIPQLSFEVIRVVDRLEGMVRAVTMIPGATEFGYSTTAHTRSSGPGTSAAENRHVATAATDFAASLDEIMEICPALERVALVVSWFGDDLRAGQCRLRPRVEASDKQVSVTWSAAGLTRATAPVVSRVNGRAAYGGTPSDTSVVAAIKEIRRRGLKPVLYPFVMMDIPAGNALADPYGGSEQAAYPWRGRITCQPAPGRSGSPDKTPAAATQIAAFVGTAAPGQFSVAGEAVGYSGPAEWTMRRMVLHYASLAVAAGGVDAFVIGSEMRGLTTVRSSASNYPFVAALTGLAADVKSVLGASTRVTYAADWTEWFGHQPADGSGDVYFHLDPLWASASIDVIGIDAYWPLGDWRYGPHADLNRADGPTDLAYLKANIAAGEGFDWFYADATARLAGARGAISDGARSKPWVFRNKDLVSWWSNQHFNRPGGVESATPTAWIPRSKPFWLTETGAPAVDLGANQPNVFPDPKSSESAYPFFSRGARDDLMQRRYAEAVIDRFDPTQPGFDAAANPISTVDGRRMLDPSGIHLWTWDARPYPAFPALSQVWADAANWSTGHWLNGRLGGTSVDGLVKAILADHGFSAYSTRAILGHVDGYVIDDLMSARQALEPLLAAFGVDALDAGTELRFAGRGRRVAETLALDDLVDDGRATRLELRRAQESELPNEIAITVSDGLRDFRRSTVTSRRLVGGSGRQNRADLAVVASSDVIAGLADSWLQDLWVARERASFALPPTRLAIEPGDILDLPAGARRITVMVDRIEEGATRRMEGRVVDRALYEPTRTSGLRDDATEVATFGPPVAIVLDLPHLADDEPAEQPYLAVFAKPWPGGIAVWRSLDGSTFRLLSTLDRRARIGTLDAALAPGPIGLWDRGGQVEVTLYEGHLASASDTEVLAGANRAAVKAADGRWEILSFARAELIGQRRYRLTRLIRAEGSTADAWTTGIAAGATFVALDDAAEPLPIRRDEIGIPITLKIGPSNQDYTQSTYASLAAEPKGRGLLPWSPAQLKARRDPVTGSVTISWLRRSRLSGADNWGAGDVPFAEAERFRVEVLSGSIVLRLSEVAASPWVYTATSLAADFATTPATLTIRVTELSPTVGPGIPTTDTLPI